MAVLKIILTVVFIIISIALKDCREYDGLFFIILKMIAYFRKMEKI